MQVMKIGAKIAVFEAEESLPAVEACRRRTMTGAIVARAGSCRLLDLMQLIGGGLVDGLNFAGGPANHRLFNLRILAQSEMQPPLVLRRKAAAAGNFLHLLLPIPEQRDLRADRAAIAGGSFQLKFDPLVLRA